MARVHPQPKTRRPGSVGGRPLLFLLCLFVLTVAAEAASHVSHGTFTLSWHQSAESFELLIEGPAELEFRLPRGAFTTKVVVDVAAAPAPWLPREIPLDDVAVQRIRVQEGPWGGQVVVDLAYPLPAPAVSRTEKGIVVTVRKKFRAVDETYVAPGVWFGQVRAGEVYGPVAVKYLKVKVGHPGVRVYPVLAEEEFGLAKVSEIAKRSGALAAVNGGFYHWSGRPLGLFIADGRLISQDVHGRTAWGLRPDGTAFIAPLAVEMGLETDGGKVIPLDGINRPRTRAEAVAYTSHYGSLPPPAGKRLAIAHGTVLGAARWQRVPAGAMVIEFDQEDVRFLGLEAGQRARFSYRVVPDEYGSLLFAIGGGPRLLAYGEVLVTGEEERFQADVVLGRAPRTAVGLADGWLYLVVVDGRGIGNSVGMTLEELAHFMKELGVQDALNMDGGGSSALVLKGRVFNHPSGGAERAVATALVVDVDNEGL